MDYLPEVMHGVFYFEQKYDWLKRSKLLANGAVQRSGRIEELKELHHVDIIYTNTLTMEEFSGVDRIFHNKPHCTFNRYGYCNIGLKNFLKGIHELPNPVIVSITGSNVNKMIQMLDKYDEVIGIEINYSCPAYGKKFFHLLKVLQGVKKMSKPIGVKLPYLQHTDLIEKFLLLNFDFYTCHNSLPGLLNGKTVGVAKLPIELTLKYLQTIRSVENNLIRGKKIKRKKFIWSTGYRNKGDLERLWKYANGVQIASLYHSNTVKNVVKARL